MSLSAIQKVDPEIAQLIAGEERREADTIRLIPSENYASAAVLAATGTVLNNKYSEGYPGKRYYEGQKFIDQIEQLGDRRAKALFGAEHANVQPVLGLALQPGGLPGVPQAGRHVMGLGLPAGGHLTHGWNVSITGKYFRSVQYGVRKDNGRFDFDEIRDLAKKEQPKLLWAGGTAVPRIIDFEKFG
jgi:glycine hydroxymethyltransferase